MMGQFSKFVPRGAIALATTGSYDTGNELKLEMAAFLNPDQSRTVVIQNGFAKNGTASVKFATGDTWTGAVYQQSVTTWVLPAAQN